MAFPVAEIVGTIEEISIRTSWLSFAFVDQFMRMTRNQDTTVTGLTFGAGSREIIEEYPFYTFSELVIWTNQNNSQ